MIQLTRLLLTSLLLYFVYQETGWATVLFLTFSAIGHEAVVSVMKRRIT